MLRLAPTGRVGVYIHIPFCLRRCPYCDFNVAVMRSVPEAAFVEALLRELEQRRDALTGRALTTIYLGGGTPSLLSTAALRRILSAVRSAASQQSEEIEITVEANPENVTQAWVTAAAEAGVNRVSLGAQSLDDAVLARLGRSHRGHEVRRSVRWLAEAGIRHISVDLIYGAPGATPQSFLVELSELASWSEVDHISAYELTFEPRTAFTVAREKGRLPVWNEAQLASCFDAVEARLETFGFERYEISNFARPGGRSRHNSSYWAGDDYLGLGPGAHSLRIDADQALALRRANGRSTRRYLEDDAVSFEEERLAPSVHLKELLMLACRRVAPLSLEALRERSDLVDEVLGPYLRSWVERGMCRVLGDDIHFTAEARRLADTLAAELF